MRSEMQLNVRVHKNAVQGLGVGIAALGLLLLAGATDGEAHTTTAELLGNVGLGIGVAILGVLIAAFGREWPEGKDSDEP